MLQYILKKQVWDQLTTEAANYNTLITKCNKFPKALTKRIYLILYHIFSNKYLLIAKAKWWDMMRLCLVAVIPKLSSTIIVDDIHQIEYDGKKEKKLSCRFKEKHKTIL